MEKSEVSGTDTPTIRQTIHGSAVFRPVGRGAGKEKGFCVEIRIQGNVRLRRKGTIAATFGKRTSANFSSAQRILIGLA